MALINVCVISEEGSTVLPWKITSADPGKELIRKYYEDTLSGTDVLESYQLSKAFLGYSKESLDLMWNCSKQCRCLADF